MHYFSALTKCEITWHSGIYRLFEAYNIPGDVSVGDALSRLELGFQNIILRREVLLSLSCNSVVLGDVNITLIHI